jgi:molecular chaperone GrpE
MKKTKAKKRMDGNVDEEAASSQAVDRADRPEGEDREGDTGVESTEAQEPTDPIERLEAKVASLEDSLLRAKADYQNLQRRLTIERGEAVRYANAELMKSLLGVMDDFERSLDAAKNTDQVDALVDGVRLVYDNFMKALTSHGLQPIKALHQAFDPHVHEAMMQQPSADFSPGTVIDEVTKGYQLHDRVLRPTRVVVSKAVEDKKQNAVEESGSVFQEDEDR